MHAEQLLLLLDQSFRQWEVDARAERRAGDPWSVSVRAPGHRDRHITPAREESRGLPAWRLAIPDAKSEPPPMVLLSVRALLRELRLGLDPDFVPSRAIIGVRPTEAKASERTSGGMRT